MSITLPTLNWSDITKGNDVLPIVRHILSSRRLPWVQKTIQTDSKVDSRWLEASSHYIQTLSPESLLTLYVYTSQDYGIIQNFLHNKQLYVSELVIPVDLSNASQSFWAVESFARSWVRDGVLERYGLSNELAKKMRDHYSLMNLIQSEQESHQWNEKWNHMLELARPYFSKVFWKNARINCVKESWRWHSHFAWAARKISGSTRPRTALSCFKKIYSSLTASDWKRILVQYVKDLDGVFEKAPSLPKTLIAFRGTRRKTRRWSSGYISTTLVKSVAIEFQRPDGCCLHQLHVKAGTRVLPLCMISRYWGEAEILLPRECMKS